VNPNRSRGTTLLYASKIKENSKWLPAQHSPRSAENAPSHRSKALRGKMYKSMNKKELRETKGSRSSCGCVVTLVL